MSSRVSFFTVLKLLVDHCSAKASSHPYQLLLLCLLSTVYRNSHILFCFCFSISSFVLYFSYYYCYFFFVSLVSLFHFFPRTSPPTRPHMQLQMRKIAAQSLETRDASKPDVIILHALCIRYPTNPLCAVAYGGPRELCLEWNSLRISMLNSNSVKCFYCIKEKHEEHSSTIAIT